MIIFFTIIVFQPGQAQSFKHQFLSVGLSPGPKEKNKNTKNKLRFKSGMFLTGFVFLCLLVGIIIATNLDLSSHSKAAVNKPEPQIPSYGNYKSPFVYVAEKVSPAVVNI